MNDPSERLRVELSFLRDNTITAARERRLGVLKDALDTYETLVRSFLTLLADMETRYDRRLALREVHGLGGEWSEVRWIESDFQDILDSALATEDRSVISDVVYFPLRLAQVAIDQRDYYIFYRFLSWIPYSYHKAKELQDLAARKYVVDRCGRYLGENMSLIVGPLLTDPSSDVEPREIADYLIGFLRAFSDLLRQAMEGPSPGDYCEFARQLTSASEAISLAFRYGEVRDGAEEAWLEVVRTQHALFLGQLAWLIHLSESRSLSVEDSREILECVNLPESPEEVWRTFLDARKQSDEDVFHWRWWELDERPEGQAGFLAFDSYLERAAVLGTLKRLGPSQTLVLPSEDAETLGREDSHIQQFLASLAEDSRWKTVVGEDVTSRAPVLVGALQDAAAREARDEGLRIVSAPLSEARMNSVAENLAKAWKSQAHGRRIASEYGAIEMREEPPDELALFGLNNWDLKVLYIDESGNWATGGWGEEYGRALATGETERLIEVMIEVAQKQPTEQLVDQLTVAIAATREAGHEPLVLIVDAWEAVLRLSEDARFVPSSDPFTEGRIGQLLGAPVHRFFAHAADGVFVGHLPSAIQWRQYPPPAVDAQANFERLIGGVLRARWRVLGEEEALQLVRDNPSWQSQNGRKLSEAEAAFIVQQRVLVTVREQFEIVRMSGSPLIFVASPE